MADNPHVTEEVLNELHKEGACLSRHLRRTNGHKCSHQWQAKVKAESTPEVYNYPAYSSLCDDSPGGMFLTAVRSESFPLGYAKLLKGIGGFWKAKPTHKGKEWNLGKTSGGIQNFDHYAVPYWHNAHHIIPNRTLAAAIELAGKDRPELVNLIKAGLLKANYNLNDKINMIILPMERIVAAALSLPRHLLRDEVGPNEKQEHRSHADYSQQVKNRIQPIIDNYKQSLAKANDESHDSPPDDLAKEQLDDLSEEIFNFIISEGPHLAGKALSQLKF